MQSLLARLYIDEYCRHLFYCRPEYVLERYTLTAAEVDALVSLDADSLDSYANALLKQREGRVRRQFPFLYAINDATESRTVEHLFQRFHSLHPATVEAGPEVEVLLFAAFVKQSLVGVEDFPAYAGDIARYDAARFQVGRNVSAGRAFPRRKIKVSDIFSPTSHTYVETFKYDVLDLARQLRDHVLPTGVRPQRTTIVLQNMDGTLRTLAVSGPTEVLLRSLNGLRTLGEAIDSVEAVYGIEGLSDSILKITRQLEQEGVITRQPA